MRLSGIKSIKAGDKLAEALKSANGKVILNAGIVLTDSYINKIRELGVHKLYIDDGRFNDVEALQTLDQKLKNEAMQVLKDTHDALQKGKTIDEYLIKEIAKSIVEFVRSVKDKGISTFSNIPPEDYILEHSINVAILSAIIGEKLSYNYNQLCDLVTGALIHDLGRENNQEEKPEHVQMAFDVMRKCRGLSLHSSIVCYEHHENFDGSGYPRKIKDKYISEFSRIIRVIDFYDDVQSGRLNKGVPVMPHEAFEILMAESGRMLDPDIVKVFRDTVVFYPNGSTVLLNNGSKAVIMRQNQGVPQRPVVKPFDDDMVGEELDLMRNLTSQITGVIL